MSGRDSVLILIAAILCGSAIGDLFPEAGIVLTRWIDTSVFLLVFLLLFEISFQKLLSRINQFPFMIFALVLNFVVIPPIGFGIAYVFLSTQPLFFIGLSIYFMAPCTDWFLGFTRLANGNTALGAALLPVNMIAQLLLYPVYLKILGIGSIETGTGEIFQTFLQWALLPLLSALVLRLLVERMLKKDLLQRIDSIVSLLNPILLAFLVGQIFVINIGTLRSYATLSPLILSAIFLFFTLTYILSEKISNLLKLNYEDRVLMTMTTGARNAPLMLAVTMVFIPNQPIIYAAIIIGMLIEFPHLIALKIILKRKYKIREIHQI